MIHENNQSIDEQLAYAQFLTAASPYLIVRFNSNYQIEKFKRVKKHIILKNRPVYSSNLRASKPCLSPTIS